MQVASTYKQCTLLLEDLGTLSLLSFAFFLFPFFYSVPTPYALLPTSCFLLLTSYLFILSSLNCVIFPLDKTGIVNIE